MFRSTVLAILMLVIVGFAHAQGNDPSCHYRKNIQSDCWQRTGEGQEGSEGYYYLTTGTPVSTLSTTVQGLWIVIKRRMEYGGGDMFVRLGACEIAYAKNES